MFSNQNIEREVGRINQEVARKTEEGILEQLNEFISRGLIVVDREGPVMYEDVQVHQRSGIKIGMKIKLRLKDQEYIEELERENKSMKETLNKIREGVL